LFSLRRPTLHTTYAPLAHRIARKLHRSNPGLSYDDIHAEVTVGLVRAIAGFDPHAGVKFITYAWRSCYLTGMTYCRREQARGFHVPENHEAWRPAMVPLLSRNRSNSYGYGDNTKEEQYGKVDERLAAVMSGADEESWRANFWRAVCRVGGLSPHERAAVLGVYRDGKTQEEVGREIGRSKQSVSVYLKEAVERMRKRGGELRAALEGGGVEGGGNGERGRDAA
jgi:RNA polymerase sigma factor (sigma-70 family)